MCIDTVDVDMSSMPKSYQQNLKLFHQESQTKHVGWLRIPTRKTREQNISNSFVAVLQAPRTDLISRRLGRTRL